MIVKVRDSYSEYDSIIRDVIKIVDGAHGFTLFKKDGSRKTYSRDYYYKILSRLEYLLEQ